MSPRQPIAACVVVMTVIAAVQADIFTDYSLVVRGNLDSTARVEGRTAVGGSLGGSASEYGVSLSTKEYQGMDVLIVGGDLQAQNVRVRAGDMRLAGSVGRTSVACDDGSVISDKAAVDMVAELGAQMMWTSAYMASLPATNTVALPSSQAVAVTFNAIPKADGVAVFKVPGASIFSSPLVQQMDLSLNGATTVIINVAGTSVTWTNGNMVGGFTSSSGRARVVWNFYEATALDLGSRNMNGSVLAPAAATKFQGVVDGSMWVNSLSQRADVRLPMYAGIIPHPGAGAVMLVGAVIAMRRRNP